VIAVEVEVGAIVPLYTVAALLFMLLQNVAEQNTTPKLIYVILAIIEYING
jgi:hypothetical protein